MKLKCRSKTVYKNAHITHGIILFIYIVSNHKKLPQVVLYSKVKIAVLERKPQQTNDPL